MYLYPMRLILTSIDPSRLPVLRVRRMLFVSSLLAALSTNNLDQPFSSLNDLFSGDPYV